MALATLADTLLDLMLPISFSSLYSFTSPLSLMPYAGADGNPPGIGQPAHSLAPWHPQLDACVLVTRPGLLGRPPCRPPCTMPPQTPSLFAVTESSSHWPNDSTPGVAQHAQLTLPSPRPIRSFSPPRTSSIPPSRCPPLPASLSSLCPPLSSPALPQSTTPSPSPSSGGAQVLETDVPQAPE